MMEADLLEFFKQILQEETVSEFTLYGIIEKVITNVTIIEDNTLCLN